MLRLLGALLPSLRSALRTSTDLALENLALRQQLAALRQQAKRPRVRFADRVWLAKTPSVFPERRQGLRIGTSGVPHRVAVYA